jgi:phosphatidylglycerol:prolipoprotein diacylglycerol transferase
VKVPKRTTSRVRLPRSSRIILIVMIDVPELVIRAGPVNISAHVLFESLAYTLGFAIYRQQRLSSGDLISGPTRSSIIVAAILGAALGSKLLALLEEPATLILSGKTIVGGLLGGTICVELVKMRLGIKERTGDLFAIPLTLGIAVGRLGCFFGGMADHTYGNPTNLPWSVNFGDGIPRHPVQIYEIVFLLMLAGVLYFLRDNLPRSGDLYRVFLVSYLAWRLAIDFLKPGSALGGLTAIQWSCLGAIIWYSRDVAAMLTVRRKPAHG